MRRLLATVAVAACAGAGPPVAGAVEQIYFTSPTGNIGCFMDPWTARCDIRDRAWSPPPRPANCPEFGVYGHDFGRGIVLTADSDSGPMFTCASDSLLNSGPAVAYGQDVQLDSIRCQIWPSGVTCNDFMTGKGFGLSREGYRFL